MEEHALWPFDFVLTGTWYPLNHTPGGKTSLDVSLKPVTAQSGPDQDNPQSKCRLWQWGKICLEVDFWKCSQHFLKQNTAERQSNHLWPQIYISGIFLFCFTALLKDAEQMDFYTTLTWLDVGEHNRMKSACQHEELEKEVFTALGRLK